MRWPSSSPSPASAVSSGRRPRRPGASRPRSRRLRGRASLRSRCCRRAGSWPGGGPWTVARCTSPSVARPASGNRRPRSPRRAPTRGTLPSRRSWRSGATARCSSPGATRLRDQHSQAVFVERHQRRRVARPLRRQRFGAAERGDRREGQRGRRAGAGRLAAGRRAAVHRRGSAKAPAGAAGGHPERAALEQPEGQGRAGREPPRGRAARLRRRLHRHPEAPEPRGHVRRIRHRGSS